MYSFLITCTMVLWPLLLHTLYSLIYIYIYIRWCMFSSPLSHMCCFLYVFIHMFLLVYNLSMFHTWCLDESCLSVSDKTSCKSTMSWSLFLQSFHEFIVGLDLCTFVNYGIVVLDFSHNCFFSVLSWISKEEDF